MNKILRIVLLLEILSLGVTAQILDDSTKLVYGPTSTRYKTVLDLKHSDTLYHTMDTSLYKLEQFQAKYNQEVPYYDLGLNGTAMTPVYHQLPTALGRTTGFYAFDPYVKSVEEFKYYDTKSPFINLSAVFGGKQRNTVDFNFSRNINPQWNIGLDIAKISTNKQLGAGGIREKQVESTNLDIYTFHRSEGGKYQMMFHAYKFEHKLFKETGGIPTNSEPKDYFQYRNADIVLEGATGADYRTRLFLYHQYSIRPFLEIYNTIERSRYRNQYVADLTNDVGVHLQEDIDFYDRFILRTDSTIDKSLMDELKLEAGVKGRVVNHIYYTAYVKRRALNMQNNYFNLYKKEYEHYLGGDLVLHINDKNEIGGAAELMDKGQFMLKGFLDNSLLKVSYQTMSSRPSYLSQRYFGNHYDWNNDFKSVFHNQIKANLSYDFDFLKLSPELEITSVTNYIYFNENKTPSQNTGTLLINNYGTNADITLWSHLHFDSRLVFNNVSGNNPETMQIPKWKYYGRWYYASIFFNDDLQMELGFDVRWQSAYKGMAYDPITQQFHIQTALTTPSYFVTDLFFVMKSNDVSMFFKLNYLNQKRDEGYFEVPYYPGMKRAFDMGVRWMFFD